MPRSCTQVAIQITRCLCPKEGEGRSIAFTDDFHDLATEVEVLQLDPCGLTSAESGVEHQPKKRHVTPIVELVAFARLEQPPDLLFGKNGWRRLINLRSMNPHHRR